MFKSTEYLSIVKFIRDSSKNTKIIAVSKNHPQMFVKEALKQGVRIFGENKVLEAEEKFLDLKKEYPDIELHLTGALQTNKVKKALSIFDVFHTLDREKLAKEFAKSLHKIIKKKLFIQINTGKEISKGGIHPNESSEFINYCKQELSLPISGLMCIPPMEEEPSHHFNMLKDIAKKNNIVDLSMGMSADYKDAVINDATYIRVGTILFGKRK
tara:strand:+ start:505 stop:1143 length:639 start_codon:yes stop_codon:yes gene_type:complete